EMANQQPIPEDHERDRRALWPRLAFGPREDRAIGIGGVRGRERDRLGVELPLAQATQALFRAGPGELRGSELRNEVPAPHAPRLFERLVHRVQLREGGERVRSSRLARDDAVAIEQYLRRRREALGGARCREDEAFEERPAPFTARQEVRTNARRRSSSPLALLRFGEPRAQRRE